MTSLRKLNASTASWILALSLPAIALADLLAPSLEPLPLVVVPVVASAVLGNPRFTAVLLAAALVIVVSLEAIQDQLAETGTWLRSCAVLIVGLISVLISTQIRSRRQLLAASEQRFRLMAEHATDVVYLASLDRRITWVSPSIEHTLGWPPQDVVDTQMADLVHPDDREATESLRQRIYSGRAFVSPKEGYLLRVRHRDGRYLWMTNKLTFVANDQGENVGVVGGLTLVDDLVEARARAQFDEELLRVTIDGVIDPVVLLQAVRDEDDTVVDFIYLDVNVAACEYLLMPASALIGELVSVTVPNTVKAGLFAKYLQVAQTGESLVCDAYRYQTAEGGLGRYFDVRASPVSRDRITVTWREVTGRAVAEGLLQESESRFRLLAENVSDVVFLADPSMNLSWVGASAQTAVGWAANDLIGRNATTFIHPDDLESVKSAIDFSRRTGEPAQLRFRWQLPDGDFTWVEALGKPVDDTGLGQPGRVISLRNVDAQVRAEQELDRSEANYRLLAENSSDVIMRMDRSGVVEWVSPSVDSALGWEPRDWVGQMATSFVHPDEIAIVVGDMTRVIEDSAKGLPVLWVKRLRARAKDGEYHWIESRNTTYRDHLGEIKGFVVSFRVIDSEIDAEQELLYRAKHDDLTGVLKRDEAMMRLNQIVRLGRKNDEQSSVLFCDIDQFKHVNDEYGHAAGDQFLRTIAHRLGNSVRAGDVVARMGGDEFLVILDGVGSLYNATAVAEKIRLAAAEPVALLAGDVVATMSIGVTMCIPGEDLDTMLARADRAMYRAKASGRNAVVQLMESEEVSPN